MSNLVNKTPRSWSRASPEDRHVHGTGLAYSAPKNGGGTHPRRAARPGLGRRRTELPIFTSVAEGKAKTRANATVMYVPPAGAADAIFEAIDAEIPLIVAITEGVPVLDMVRVKARLERS